MEPQDILVNIHKDLAHLLALLEQDSVIAKLGQLVSKLLIRVEKLIEAILPLIGPLLKLSAPANACKSHLGKRLTCTRNWMGPHTYAISSAALLPSTTLHNAPWNSSMP